jgi:hypothetical protein
VVDAPRKIVALLWRAKAVFVGAPVKAMKHASDPTPPLQMPPLLPPLWLPAIATAFIDAATHRDRVRVKKAKLVSIHG